MPGTSSYVAKEPIKPLINFRRLNEALHHAFRGLCHTLFFHQNLRVHIFVAVIAATLGIIFKITTIEWLAVLVAIFLVLVAEMVNTAIEEVINLVKEEHSERAKIAKDVSAGMVLMAAIFALIVGVVVFLPHLI